MLGTPGVWIVDLERLVPGAPARPLRWVPGNPAAARLDRIGGSAGALCALEAALREPGGARSALALAAGSAVAQALPTAARAAVAGVAPLTGRYVEGQVGGELGSLLADLGAPLLVRGRAQALGGLLILSPGPRAQLLAQPQVSGRSPGETRAFLEQRFPGSANLRVGPAGEWGARTAGLVSGESSFVGRGGLGARLGADLGLKAIVLVGFQRPVARSGAGASLVQRLLQSPRLELRSELGTLELFHAAGARRELGFEAASGRALAVEAERSRSERHGCRGCPTPCGWSFDRPAGPAVRAHFGATAALLDPQGPGRLEDALGLLAEADALGVDAKELGVALAIWARAKGRPLDPRFAQRVLSSSRDRDAPEAVLLDGAVATAVALGLEPPAHIHGQVEPRGANALQRLAQSTSTGGSDPMRAFPFLEEQGPQRLGVTWVDPGTPGSALWWHENLIAALDAFGFCAFAAAGLLADGLLSVGELAQQLGVAGGEAGPESAERAFLAVGARLIARRLEFNRDLGLPSGSAHPPGVDPVAFRDYAACRGLGFSALDPLAEDRLWSAPRARALALLNSPAPSGEPRGVGLARSPGTVEVTSIGPLARALAQHGSPLELGLPASLGEVLHALEACSPALSKRLFRGDQLLPAVFRRGQRLALTDSIEHGDELELVLAIAGG